MVQKITFICTEAKDFFVKRKVKIHSDNTLKEQNTDKELYERTLLETMQNQHYEWRTLSKWEILA